MTLVNTWESSRADRSGAQRRFLITCDRAQPPQLAIGTAAEISAFGWKFDDLRNGPHSCPWCARRYRREDPPLRTASRQLASLPNVLVIGAGKCGTTSLHRYLAAHPRIHMAEAKELRFFQDPGYRAKLDEYATFFDGSAPVRGESSAIYTLYPLAPGVPERVRATIPDVRLIYLVRDPIERTVSHFVERRAHGWHRGESLEDALGDPTDPFNLYVAPSKYATQLERYMKHFPRDQIMVVEQTDLLSRRRETLRALFGFLGVDEDFWSARYEERHNLGVNKVRWTYTGRRLVRSRMAGAARSLLPPKARNALYAPVRRMTTRKLEPPVLSDAMRDRLRDVFREEVVRLRELTDKQLAGWQV
jgi:Sulfotransferase domain